MEEPAAAQAAPPPASTPPVVEGFFHPVATTTMPSVVGWRGRHPVLGHRGWGQKVMSIPDEKGRYTLDERQWRGMLTTYIRDVVGDFAERPYIMGLTDTGRAVGEGEIYRRNASGGWKKIRQLKRSSYYAGLHRWSKGRLLTYVYEGGFVRTGKRPRFLVVEGGGDVSDLPIPTMEKTKNLYDQEIEGPRVQPNDMFAFPSGEVYVVGHKEVEYWAPGKRKGTVFSLPGYTYRRGHVADGECGIYLMLGDEGIVHVVGEEVTTVDTTAIGGVAPRNANLAVTSDGTLWLSTDAGTSVWRRPSGGEWEQVGLPGEVAGHAVQGVVSLAARGDRICTVAKLPTSKEAGYALLCNGEAPERVQTVAADWDWTAQYGTKGLDRPKPARSGCRSIFALFYGITKYAAPGYDFPKARKALTGHKEFEGVRFVKTDVHGQKFFGAFVESLDEGRRLVALIGSKVEGSTPQLLCHDPKVVAELPIDLTDGTTTGWKPIE